MNKINDIEMKFVMEMERLCDVWLLICLCSLKATLMFGKSLSLNQVEICEI